MKLSSYTKSAVGNLFYSWLRTMLAMLGIMIGTASVVALVSFGKLATEQALEQFKSLGTNKMSISISASDESDSTSKKINPAIFMAMKDQIPDIQIIAPYNANYVDTGVDLSTLVIGTNEHLATILNLSMQEGRFILPQDKNQFFCVLGSGISERLEKHFSVGQSIKLGKIFFTIIGIAAESPDSGFFTRDINKSIFVSLSAAKLIAPKSDPKNIMLQLKEETNINAIKSKISTYLEAKLPGFNISIQSAEELVKKMAAQEEIFTLLLGLIGAISLLVGGIGVMNIMLASVAERRNEIGLRLALGAQPKDIQIMFLMEASLLAVIGGGIGVLVAQLCTYIMAWVNGWNFVIFFMPSFIGFSVSLLISVFFGFYPAYVASKLNPIEALRSV